MSENKKNGKDISVDFLEETQKINEEAKKEASGKTEDKQTGKKTSKAGDAAAAYQEKYEETRKKYDDLHEQFLRLRAEFANYKKRVEREQIEYAGYIKGEIVKKILPVLDDMSHMVEKSQGERNEQSVLEGAKMIYEKFNQALKELGVEQIEAQGKEFDPQIHEAMMMQKIPDKAQHNKVLNVFQNGYKINNRLLRPSKVIVGNFEEDGD